MGLKDALDDVAFMNSLFTIAEEEAHQLGDEIPGAEHLLLAALVMDDESGREALQAAGINANALRAAITACHAEALREVGVLPQDAVPIEAANRGPFRSSATSQQVFRHAVAISKARRPRRLRTADVVRAVAELQSGTAARVITSLGLDRARLVAVATSAATPR